MIAITNPATILSFMVVFSMFRIGGNESVGENVQLILVSLQVPVSGGLQSLVIVSLYRKKGYGRCLFHIESGFRGSDDFIWHRDRCQRMSERLRLAR